MKCNLYEVYGLTISSEFELPELVPVTNTKPNVFIKEGNVPEHLPFAKEKGLNYEAHSNDFLFKLNNVIRCRIQNGETITVKFVELPPYQLSRIILLGTGLGILLLQKGILPIHGSAIHTKKGACVFSGPSSSGKSSLLAWFLKMGYSAIADDIAAIKPENKLKIYHGIPYMKIWEDIVQYCEIENITRLRPELNKYSSPIINQFNSADSELHRIIILSRVNKKDFSYEVLNGSDKITALISNTYRHRYIHGMGIQAKHFSNIIKVATEVDIIKVYRPSKPLLLRELAEYIERFLIE